MILKRIGQTIFWIVEVCGILLISLSVVLLFLLTLAKVKSGTWPQYNLAMFWDDLHLPHLENAQKIAEVIIATISRLPAWTAVLVMGVVVYAVGWIGRSVVDLFRQKPLSR
jgi:hypothetical protein